MKQWINARIKVIKEYYIRPRLTALAYALAVFIGLFVLWLYIGSRARERLMLEERTQVANQVNTIGTSLTLAVNQRLALITSVRSYIEAEIKRDADFGFSNAYGTEQVNNFVSGLYNSTAGIRNIAIAPDGVMQFVYPYEENKAVLGYNPAEDERPFVRDEVIRAIQMGEIILSLPYNLIQGGQGLIARQAIYINGRYWGLANVVLDLPPLLGEAGINPPPAGLDIAIMDQSGTVFFGSAIVLTGEPVTYEVELPEGNWILAAVPVAGWGWSYKSIMWFYYGMGLIGIITIPLVVYLFINRRDRLADLVNRRTQELVQSNQTLITVLEGIDADVYVADFDTYEILFANKHIRESFKDNLVGKICYEIFRGESLVCAHCKNNLLLDGGRNPTGVHLWDARNPITERWYKNADRAIRWHDGRYVHLQIATDITEQRQAVDAIREREVKLDSIFRAAPIGIGMVINRFIQEANDTLCKMTGYSREELIGKSARMLYPSQEDFEYVGKEKYRQIHERSIGTVETRWLRKDGVIRDILLSSVPLDSGDLSKGVTFTALDITERKQAENTIQESERRYRSIVESSPLGMHMYELQPPEKLIFSGSNPAADAILGVDNSFFVGKTIEEAFPPLVATEVPRRYKAAAKNGVLWRTEQLDYDADGIKGAFEVVAFQTTQDKMVAMFHDVTARKRAEEALRTKTAELEALFSISSHLRSAQSADAMLPLVLEEIRRVLRSDANAVILLEPDEKHFTYALCDGSLAVNNNMQFDIEKSISGLVLQTRQPYITDNLSVDTKKTSTLQGDENLGPAVIAPVVSESEFLGVLLCARHKGNIFHQYTSSDVQLLTAIGEMVGNALRRARLYDQAITRLQYVQTLHSIDMAISANLDLSVILDVLLSQCVTQMDVDAACVLLLNPYTHMLEFAAGNGFYTKEIKSTQLRLGEGLPGKTAMERRVLHIPDLVASDDLVRSFLLDEEFISYWAAPLIAKGQLQGVLEVFKRKPFRVDDEQFGFMETLATQAAIAIDNSRLFSDLQHSNFELEMAYDATIEGWSLALELRDQETEGHTLRVADMTVRLAQAMGVKDKELLHLRRGALLHDIGKMGIPDRILLKPGKLTGEEWELMKQHPVYAFEMLWPIEFLRPAIDIPYCHHERWDGTGYPRQLEGEQIPLSARIFAVVDVWDALTSDRPYRDAWSEQEAIEYLMVNIEKHFDPQIIEKFMALRTEGDSQ